MERSVDTQLESEISTGVVDPVLAVHPLLLGVYTVGVAVLAVNQLSFGSGGATPSAPTSLRKLFRVSTYRALGHPCRICS